MLKDYNVLLSSLRSPLFCLFLYNLAIFMEITATLLLVYRENLNNPEKNNTNNSKIGIKFLEE